MSKNCYVDIHVIQTVPPSCVNRDDTGSPKTAVYGGTTRARVSSQAWKHAMREEFKELFPEEQIGKRTKRIIELISAKVLDKQPELDYTKVDDKIVQILKDAGWKIKSIAEGTDALFFMSDAQAEAMAQLALSEDYDALGKKEKNERMKAALRDHPSVDMALFGRMVAGDPSLKYDACAQVAHAISTHTVHTEYDYFTAVDDCAPEDNAGAGHLGTVEFNSATLYRYATINVRELAGLIGTLDTPDVVGKFVYAFLYTMPTGKQNTFANRTVPDMVYIVLRDDQPINLCGAFEKPVYTKNGGYVEGSCDALVKYAKDVYENFVGEPYAAVGVGKGAEKLANRMNAHDAYLAVNSQVRNYLEEMG